MEKNIFEKAMIIHDIQRNDFCNLPQLMRDIITAEKTFDRFTFKENRSLYDLGELVKWFEKTMDKYLEIFKPNILKMFGGSSADTEKQIFETYVTFINDNYYVNYLFSVGRALKIIKEDNITPIDMKIEDVMEFSELISTNKITTEVQNDTPIILVHNPATIPQYLVVDGNHRVKQKYMQGATHVEAYVLNKKYINEISVCEPIYTLIQLMLKTCDIFLSYRVGIVGELELLKLVDTIDRTTILK